MLNTKTLLEQFQTFCKRNNPRSQEEAVNYFAVFGGLDININTTVPIEILIEKLIFNKYKYLRNDISALTKGDNAYHLILSGIALGDRRTNSAFRRAKISFDDGINIVDDLCKLKVLKLEKSLQSLSALDDQYTVSEKLLFTSPFVRFWFAIVSPLFQGIKEGNYKEAFDRFKNRESEFTALVFEQLSHELLKLSISNDEIPKLRGQSLVKLGRYWDDDIDIDLLAKTKSGKVIAGACKYSNSKIKKSELTKLKEKCKQVNIDVDVFVLFSKKGYSSELKSLKSDSLKLFTVRNFNF
ncbi:MAG: hypothetical protein KAQ94_00265 [Arcobacteraceae bacterium]|nr:hypothetical protein [Arcobacteraceae bacterium]